MRHIFIVNNTAGGGKKTVELIPNIDSYFHEKGGNYEIVATKSAGDATRIAREYAQTGEELRIYACGGDGTLHEVVNGVAGYKNVELGCFPCGTGNDYVASFAKAEEFMDVEGQVKGCAVEVDLMLTEGIYSVNQCSMGFDAAVADNVRIFKSKPMISGSMAYILSVLYTFCGKMHNHLTIQIDDREPIEGEYMFAIAAKGNFHGGGMKSAPEANPTSRSINFVLVKGVKRHEFFALFPKYIKGTHLVYDELVKSDFGRKMRVTAKKPLPVTLDGEIIVSQDITTEIVSKGLKFVLPARVAAKSAERVARPAALKR